MTTDIIQRIDDLESKLTSHLQDSTARNRWKEDPVSVLEDIGLPVQKLDQERKAFLSEKLSSTDLQVGGAFRCIGCRNIVFGLITESEAVVVFVIIAAIAAITLSFVDGEGEALAVATFLTLDEAGEAAVATELLEGGEAGAAVAVRTGATITGVDAPVFARACTTAFRQMALFIKSHPAVSLLGIPAVLRFNGTLTDEICKARRDCS